MQSNAVIMIIEQRKWHTVAVTFIQYIK